MLFPMNESRLPPGAAEELDRIAEGLKTHVAISKLEIAGHARQGERNPRTLSRARAERVFAELVRRHVPRERLLAVSYAAYCPRASLENGDLNGRVQFEIVVFGGGATTAERGCDAATEAGLPPPAVGK
jgi:outer membrane protein OmpA-like peptidoglycan-associated protein